MQRKATRIQSLVKTERSEAKQEGEASFMCPQHDLSECWCAEAMAEYLDGKIKEYAHLELQRLFEQVRAYEFTFLASESAEHHCLTFSYG